MSASESADDDSPSAAEAPDDERPSTAAALEDDSSSAGEVPEGDSRSTTEAPDAGYVDPYADLEGPAPGVTDDTIRIGITYIDLGSIEGLTLNHGDYEANYRAVIDMHNAAGGVNGRILEPVFAPISLADGGNADAVCVQLTEDEEVFVVMGFFLDDAPACYVEGHGQAIIGGTMTEDLLARANAPWFTTEIGGDFEFEAAQTFAEEGLLDGPFAIYASVAEEGVVNDSILPALEAAGVAPLEIAINDAPTNDTAANESLNAAILQRFEVVGVETVLAPGNSSTSFAQALETSSYRPRLLATNSGSLIGWINSADERDLSVLDNVVAANTFGPDSAIFSEPRLVECIDAVKAAGLYWIGPDDYLAGVNPDQEFQEGERPFVSTRAACAALALFTQIATAAGPNLNYASFQAAGYEIGDVQIPGIPDPYFYGPPPSSDGDPPVYLYHWDQASESFVIEP